MNVTFAQSTNGRIEPAPPDAKPKRPLSAFNLFYRFKRQKVIEAMAVGTAPDKDSIRALVAAAPGSEYLTASASEHASPELLNSLRRENIQRELEGNADPRDTRARLHRKNQGAMNGTMSFVEMGKLMNTSWKNCDSFAKSVFSEISEEGRGRYRRRVEEYNARSRMNVTKADEVAHRDKSAKKILPAKKTRSASFPPPPPLSSLNAKKNTTAKVSPLPTRKDEESDGGIATNGIGMADSMAFAKCTPSDDNKMRSSFTKKDDHPAGPSLLDLLAKSDIPNEAKSTSSAFPVRNNFSVSTPSSSRDTLSVFLSHAPSDIDARLMWRVRELEHQLAGERLQARARAFQDEISRWNAGGAPSRSSHESAMSRNALPAQALAVPDGPLMNDGLWSLVSASLIHPSVRASERAAMLSRITMPSDPRRRYSVMRQMMNSLESLGEHPSKKQRFS